MKSNPDPMMKPMRLTNSTLSALTVSVLLLLVGCGDAHQAHSEEHSEPGATHHEPSSELAALFLKAEPQGARDVLAVRADAEPGDTVVVRGRLKDFVEGMAAFTLTDESKRPCGEPGDPMGDACKTPWDYCCIGADEIALATTAVELHGANGLVRESIEGVSGLDHLDVVVVEGKFERDDAGNTTVRATGLFKQAAPAPADSE